MSLHHPLALLFAIPSSWEISPRPFPCFRRFRARSFKAVLAMDLVYRIIHEYQEIILYQLLRKNYLYLVNIFTQNST